MTQPDSEPMSVEERVARHLAAKDWLTTSDHWDQGRASFRADYLNHAREVIAIVREAEPAPQSPADRAAEEVAKHVVRAIFALKTPSPDGSQHYRSGWDDGLEAAMDAARDAVLAVLPETVDRAAVRAEALGEGADAVAADRAATIPVHTAWARGMTRAEELLRRLAGEQPTNSKAPTDRAAIERAFAERLAAELTGCCTECDACIEIAQHLAGKDEPAAEERKQPPMDPVHILGIDGEPAPVAEPPAAADGEAVRRG
ncbi:hypothetical protein EASAB2608_06233 [Streptomyces sp. EAS-AB2608]|uniref:hypothetical protein n=1 Tax=Streptomyces sp. EAS-AB2608 TaxID=2779671 RepID=UPI001BEED7EB|nr:hypothetical protein [Streptomyces sp. EAS-AB2608]BCM70899.1 hypothetical protein EASAB2608_06233 [Streptomyces sp. EAS-AB2608]